MDVFDAIRLKGFCYGPVRSWCVNLEHGPTYFNQWFKPGEICRVCHRRVPLEYIRPRRVLEKIREVQKSLKALMNIDPVLCADVVPQWMIWLDRNAVALQDNVMMNGDDLEEPIPPDDLV